MATQEKKLKNWYIQEHTTGTTFEPKLKKKIVTKMNIDNGDFQTQSPQRLVNKYEHIYNRNGR